VERTATHDTEYVDIVLGYHHILLFSLVFGLLIFGTGFFIGYYRARSDEAGRAAATTTNPPASKPASSELPLPPVEVPAMLTEPPAANRGDVVKDMEQVSTGTLTPAGSGASAGAAAPQAAPAAAPQAPAATAPAAAPSNAQPAAPQSATPRGATPPPAPPQRQSPPASNGAAVPARAPEPRAAAKPANASGNVYLQVSTFAAAQEAEKLINDLASEGFRAMIDGQLVEGHHTVLVGPFADFQTAVGQAKVLKEHNREAFPIRR
jgi:cell division septation protein DedD